MNGSRSRRGRAALVALCVLLAGNAWSGRAHVHGELRADVAVDGAALTVLLQMPLDTLVGFEHRPRTAAQRQAAEQALARARDVDAWVQPVPAARCERTALELQAQALTPAAAGTPEPAHADLELQVEFRCAEPARLERLQLTVFERFPRAQRVEVQLATPAGQWRQTLRRPQREILLRR